MTTTELIERLKSNDDKQRGEAWQNAGPLGAGAVPPLADLMANSEMETARAAKRALWKIVRHAGRPGAEHEREAAAKALVPLLAKGDPNSRREWVWMLSEIGDATAVPALAALLAEQELREHARAALQRIPGKESLAALKAALKDAPAEYRPAVAVSLRVRGEKVRDYPPAKLVPTKKTEVKQPPLS